MKIKQLKKGDFFILSPANECEVKSIRIYIRGDYDRYLKRYFCQSFDDISRGRYFSGDKEVFTDFVF